MKGGVAWPSLSRKHSRRADLAYSSSLISGLRTLAQARRGPSSTSLRRTPCATISSQAHHSRQARAAYNARARIIGGSQIGIPLRGGNPCRTPGGGRRLRRHSCKTGGARFFSKMLTFGPRGNENKKGKRGTKKWRRRIFGQAMSGTERKRRWRELHRFRLAWPEDRPFFPEFREWEASAFEPPTRLSQRHARAEPVRSTGDGLVCGSRSDARTSLIVLP